MSVKIVGAVDIAKYAYKKCKEMANFLLKKRKNIAS